VETGFASPRRFTVERPESPRYTAAGNAKDDGFRLPKKKKHTAKSDACPGKPDNLGTPFPFKKEAKSDSRDMKKRGRHDKPDSISDSRCDRRDLRSVGVAVKEREHAGRYRADCRRETECGCDQNAEKQHRQYDPLFHEQKGDSGHADHATDPRDENERQRDDPERSATELRRPDPDRNHRKQMIQTSDRMADSVLKTEKVIHTGMRVRDGRCEQRNRSEYEWETKWSHTDPPGKVFYQQTGYG